MEPGSHSHSHNCYQSHLTLTGQHRTHYTPVQVQVQVQVHYPQIFHHKISDEAESDLISEAGLGRAGWAVLKLRESGGDFAC